MVDILPDTSTHKFAPRCHLIFFFFDSPLDFVFLSFLKRGFDIRDSDVVLHNWLDYITLSTFQWNSYFSFSASTNVFLYWKMLFAYYTTILLNETKRKHVHQMRINMWIVLDIISQRRKFNKIKKTNKLYWHHSSIFEYILVIAKNIQWCYKIKFSIWRNQVLSIKQLTKVNWVVISRWPILNNIIYSCKIFT